MQDQPQYQHPVTALLQLMRTTFAGSMNAYYEGDPIQIPEANLPCIIIDEPALRVRQGGTSQDILTTEIRIKLVLNKKDDYDASPNIDMTERKLRRYVEGRHPETGKYLDGTALQALRTHITLGSKNLDMQIDVRYDLQPRPGGLVTSEARISIVTTESVIRDSEATSI